MGKIGDLFKTDDWKSEKHVPVIDCPEKVNADDIFEISVSLGKEVSHPNTTEHHIRWIVLYFIPEGTNTPYQIGNFEFTAHGESAEGADTGPVYTHHAVTAFMKTGKPGPLIAASLCNIHGLWENQKQIKLS
jgi:superoxide reductase